MLLTQLESGCCGRVVRIGGGYALQERLGQLGIHPDDILTLENQGTLRGPILVNVHGMRVALGRGIATKIDVEPSVPRCAKGRHHHRRRRHG